MSSSTQATTGALATTLILAISWIVYHISKFGSREPGLPPGPPTVPILGNLLDFPSKHVYLKFQEWAKIYGEIYSLKLGSNTAIVLNSPKMIREFLETNSANTSDRPDWYVPEYTTDGYSLVFARYGSTWRNLRRAVHDILTKEACTRHLPIQRAESTQLLYDILKEPENVYHQCRRYSTSVILSVVFGTRTPHFNSHVIKQFEGVQRKWDHINGPGATPPIDIFRFLRYIPERWAPWKAMCNEIKVVKESCISVLRTIYKLNDLEVNYAGGILLEAGSDTTAVFLQFFVACLVEYPQVQKQAQKEIDAVVGLDRSPILDDWENLPYLQAVVREVHRFRPIVPSGVPHTNIQDQVIEGYYVPKGTYLFMNTWTVSHDENDFDQPGDFIPERFLKTEFGTKEGVDDSARRHDLPFGSGRRICPGMQLANNSIMMNAMNLVWAFNFNQTCNPQTGELIPIDLNNLTEGVLSIPKPFICDIQPRSQGHADIIRNDFMEARSIFAEFEQELSKEDSDFVSQY
ncbi:cytochrome P450 family protein [Abortiporus biennis]